MTLSAILWLDSCPVMPPSQMSLSRIYAFTRSRRFIPTQFNSTTFHYCGRPSLQDETPNRPLPSRAPFEASVLLGVSSCSTDARLSCLQQCLPTLSTLFCLLQWSSGLVCLHMRTQDCILRLVSIQFCSPLFLLTPTYFSVHFLSTYPRAFFAYMSCLSQSAHNYFHYRLIFNSDDVTSQDKGNTCQITLVICTQLYALSLEHLPEHSLCRVNALLPLDMYS